MQAIRIRKRQVAQALVITAALWTLAGCGTVSHGIAQDGTDAQQLIWPDVASTNGLAKDGSYPAPQAIALVHPGMNKGQVQKLLGPPHFAEGYGPREWDYVFHLRGSEAEEFHVCQFKLLFGEDGKVGSQYWLPAGCMPQAPLAASPAAPVALPPPAPRTETLQADGLFGFDRWAIGDLLPQGRRDLDALAAKLRDPQWRLISLRIDAYTDRLGSAAYNQALSQRRAATIAQYLVQQGVEQGRIQAQGRGASKPVSKDCSDSLARQALIACLAVDRRVALELDMVPRN